MFGWLFGSDKPDDKAVKSDKDSGLFGIDWDMDGKVSEFDDLMTMEIFDEDEE